MTETSNQAVEQAKSVVDKSKKFLGWFDSVTTQVLDSHTTREQAMQLVDQMWDKVNSYLSENAWKIDRLLVSLDKYWWDELVYQEIVQLYNLFDKWLSGVQLLSWSSNFSTTARNKILHFKDETTEQRKSIVKDVNWDAVAKKFQAIESVLAPLTDKMSSLVVKHRPVESYS